MTRLLIPQSSSIVYSSSDGEPLAETYIHLYAILVTLEVLKQYLQGRQATVLANQFLYYSEGFPRLRVAPDVMVIFDVTPGGRDNYKIWEEKQVPIVVFEMTSEGTKNQDQGFKKTLYEQLGVQEYWLFDPKGEWISEQLQGYRLDGDRYKLITDGRSDPLQLRLQVEGGLIGFYREDTGEKLLIPEELAQALQATEARAEQAEMRAEQAEMRAEQAEVQVEQLKAQLRALGIHPDEPQPS
ncbi:MAG: Uma2 family endonuclease [Cyanobacteria bacterium CRU_2_1]|nr:Uma2 family endonuclease [Cyanobacteria bacterium RU_5_0]NJR58496.1 Uma2 family endonuclease [Cyanobacteria bacterium CRU_2_1]NJR58506.1 Uma2 family endonuclease [Cyanobacteria bacterium CRU_2_1]